MTDLSAYEKAMDILSGFRSQSERELEIRKGHIYAKLPRLSEIDRKLAGTGVAVAKALLSGSERQEEQIQKLKEENLRLQAEREKILADAGLSLYDMELHHHCDTCGDTGYVKGKMCSCLRRLMRSVSYRKLCQDFPMEEMTFATFSLNRYDNADDRRYMEQIYDFCVEYAKDFSPAHSSSLYFYGGTGLGKTHLSLAIAGAVTENGSQVIYGSWQGFLSRLEEQKFTAGQSMEPLHEALTSCDLLILDDLGAEFVTTFAISCLHQILNTRLNRGLPTIISSNLSPDQLISTYNDRITSRICGCYELFPFQGRDQRLK